jgi:hypothetical protein
MISSHIVHSIYQKYISLQPVLHERVFRMWAASETKQLGCGGISVVSLATGMSQTTIRRGLLKLASTNEQLDTDVFIYYKKLARTTITRSCNRC